MKKIQARNQQFASKETLKLTSVTLSLAGIIGDHVLLDYFVGIFNQQTYKKQEFNCLVMRPNQSGKRKEARFLPITLRRPHITALCNEAKIHQNYTPTTTHHCTVHCAVCTVVYFGCSAVSHAHTLVQ